MFVRTSRLMPFILVLMLGIEAWAAPASFRGKVVAVADGDTITVLDDSKTQVRVRLNGIDAPESAQAFGTRARQFVSGACFGKIVTIQSAGKDRYGRTLGDVILEDGRNLNQELVRAGMAWHYKQYSKDETLAALENEARQKRVGLWADPNPTPPWEFRSTPKTQAPSARQSGPGSAGEVYITTSGKGTKYHRSNCRTLAQSTTRAITVQEAQRTGLGPCGVCKP